MQLLKTGPCGCLVLGHGGRVGANDERLGVGRSAGSFATRGGSGPSSQAPAVLPLHRPATRQ